MGMTVLKLTSDKDAKKARKWCKENFGDIPLRVLTIVHNKNNKKTRWKERFEIYDEDNARWVHRLNDPTRFKFQDEEDAMAFKLVWL